MKDFDLEKILKDPSKIELDPTSPLTWALGAGALLVLILLATILFFLIRGIRRSLEARGQRKAAERGHDVIEGERSPHGDGEGSGEQAIGSPRDAVSVRFWGQRGVAGATEFKGRGGERGGVYEVRN